MNNSRCSRPWRRDELLPFMRLSLLTFLIALALSAPAFADPPGRIGRVAWLSQPGSLALDSRSSGETFRAPLNQPLTSGDVVRTDGSGRAEIQIGSMTLRLDENTALELFRIDDERVSIFLRNGRSIVKLPSPEIVREFELSTPDGRFTARDTGIFRVEADDSSSSATAYDGTLHFSANNADFDIRTGESADIWFAGQTRYRLSSPVSDDFMRWSAARDQRPLANTSSRYVSAEMTGAEDLDAYGDWAVTPDFGPVWVPRAVAVDWAPFQTGHWSWVAPWGWSWVGHEPWGFAPFHYGHWIQYHGRWGWVPGARITRPVYAPARPFVHGAPIRKYEPSPPQFRRPHRGDDDRRNEKHREARDSKRERQPEARPQTKPLPPAKPPHPEMVFVQLGQPGQVVKPPQRKDGRPEQRPEAQRRTPRDEDSRKHRHRQEGGERH